MKLLTRAEHAALSWLASPAAGTRTVYDGDAEDDLRQSLIEQGRIAVGPSTRQDCFVRYYITPAGLEALRLHGLLAERGLVSP